MLHTWYPLEALQLTSIPHLARVNETQLIDCCLVTVEMDAHYIMVTTKALIDVDHISFLVVIKREVQMKKDVILSDGL